MPNAAERLGDFSAAHENGSASTASPIQVRDPINNLAQFPGNVIPPSRISKSGQALLNILPLPNLTAVWLSAACDR